MAWSPDPQTAADLQALSSGAAPATLPIGANAGLPPGTPQPVGPVASYAPTAAPAPMASVDPAMSVNAPPGAVSFAPGAAEGQGQGPAPVAVPKPVVVPGGWTPTSRNTQMQSGVQYSPETYAALQAASQAGNRVDEDQRQALEAQQKEAQKEAAARAAQADADMAEFTARKAAQAQARTQALGKVQNAQDAFAQAQAQGVDPNHWWASKDTGSKIAMAIGAMAGGWLVGTGATGQNPMLEQINKSIDRDVQAQRDNIAGKGRSLDNAMSMYSLARQSGLDEDQSADAAKLLAHQQLDAHLKAQLPDAQNALGKLALDKAIQDNQAKIAQLRAGIEEKASDKTAVSGSESFRQPTVVGGPPTEAAVRALAVKLLSEGKYGTPDEATAAARQVLTSQAGPANLTATTKGAAGAGGRALAKPMMAAQANLKDLQRLKELSSGKVAGFDTRNQAEQVARDLKARGINLPEPGVIGNIASAVTGSYQSAIDAAIRTEQNKLQAAMQTPALLQQAGAGGGGGGGGEEEEPEGFEGD